MKRLLTPLAALLALAALAACHDRPPAAAAARPVLERPVITLPEPATDVEPWSRPPRRIPRAALVERAGVPGVFVLDAPGEAANGPSVARGPRLAPIGEARFRMVKTGRLTATEAEILSGLHGGETLVLGDLRDVHDGSPITAVPARR
jgi:hypothetical protein